MVNIYSKLSIRLKIIALAIFVSTVVSVVSILSFYLFDKKEILEREVRDVQTMTEWVSNFVGVHMEFHYNADTERILQSFDTLVHITQVKVYQFSPQSNTHFDKPFGAFIRPNQELNLFLPYNLPRDTIRFEDNYFAVYRRTFDRENTVNGTVILVASLDFYKQQKARILYISLLMMLLSALLSYLLVIALQGYITAPLLALYQRVFSISQAKNYGIEHAPTESKDEVARLSSAFESMLEKIEDDNASLIAANEAALASVRAKDEFLAKMSHEIRTPLNAIMGLANLLEQSTLNADQGYYVKNIRSSSENLLVIINEILDFSKIQAGKLTIEQHPFDLFDLLDAFKGSIKIGIDEKGLGLHFSIAPTVPRWVVGDRVRLQQILLNLASNATKFTDKGEVSVRVELISQTADRAELKFVVKDTGIGIPKDKLEDIFGSFNQASSSTTRKYGGTGLGLTIARQLVELQGGQLKVESDLGAGSAFFFNISFAKAQTPTPIPANQATGKDQLLTQIAAMNLRILLVEDNALNRVLAKRILSTANVQVREAVDGHAAINELRNHTFDLVLMDLHMPDLDGYKTTEYIRSQFEAPIRDIPIIALTAAATMGEVEKCFQAGMNEFVSKPIHTETLLLKILQLLQINPNSTNA